MRKHYWIIVLMLILIFSFNGVGYLAEDTDLKEGINQNNQMSNIFDEHVLVALGELYFGGNMLEGNLEVIEDTDPFQETLIKGRLSFYLQGKIKGKYLLTAWLDTGEENIENLFNDIISRKTTNPFEKIDPDKYYPVYGDGSIISSEVNTSGKFYLALSSSEFKALWGDYKLSYNKNNLINYNRNNYGFNLEYDKDVYANIFWNQPLSLRSQDELKLTGGILYYLRKNNLISGSEVLRLELRETVTDRVIKNLILTKGIDYDINYLQGRIILKKSIEQIAGKNLIEDKDLEDRYFLIAEYEYDYQDTAADAYGLETAVKITEGLDITGNYIYKQDGVGEEYQILGLSLTYSPILNADLKIDWASSKNILSGKFYSEDGGLTYSQVPIVNNEEAARAWNLEYQQDFANNEDIKDASWRVYYSNKEEGFSGGSQLIDKENISYGIDLSGVISEINTELSYNKKEEEEKNTGVFSINLNKKYNEKLDIEGELQHKKELGQQEKTSLTAAVGFDYTLDDNKTVYGSQQLTLSKSGNSQDNNITKIGGKVIQDKWKFNLEGNIGSKKGLLFGVGYQLNESSEIYSNISSDFKEEGTATETTIGTKSKINEDIDLYGEYKKEDSSDESKNSNVLGLDYSPLDNWLLSLNYTNTTVDNEEDSNVKRDIIGINSSYRDNKVNFTNKVEYRKDNGNQEFNQLIATSNLLWNYNQELTILSEFEYLNERNDQDLRFIEGTVGIAYRPIEWDRLNLISKYTYLSNKNSGDEEREEWIDKFVNYPAENSQIFALDLVYQLTEKWQILSKLAYKKGEVKFNINDTDWTDNQTILKASRLNYQLQTDIELFAEYRILENSLADDKKSGFLLGGYKLLPDNLKLGVGYNFTDFNDDLTDLNYQADGLFVNLIKYW